MYDYVFRQMKYTLYLSPCLRIVVKKPFGCCCCCLIVGV